MPTRLTTWKCDRCSKIHSSKRNAMSCEAWHEQLDVRYKTLGCDDCVLFKDSTIPYCTMNCSSRRPDQPQLG
jgi:hypothetical protein